MAQYNDLDLNFDIDPVTGDIGRLEDEEAVKESVKNIVMTSLEEALFDPDLGTIIPRSHFGNFSFFNSYTIEQSIKRSLDNYEPRIGDTKVYIAQNQMFNEINIGIFFKILSLNKDVSIGLIVDRNR